VSRSLVDIEAVTVRYGDHTALREVSLTIEDGELLALLGPSGCGKTTLLRSIAGLVSPTAGNVSIDGRSMEDWPTRLRPIGMVFQAYALFPNMRVLDNAAFPLRVGGASRQVARERARHYLELVGLEHLATRYPRELSGGQQQRVALARALAREPQVLLLDEPLSALDAQVRVTLRNEIRRLQQDLGITTIYVTHDQAEALAIADRVALMRDGRIEQLGRPHDVYNTPATRFAAQFVGTRNAIEVTVDAGYIRFGALALRASTTSGRNLITFRAEDVRLSPVPTDDDTLSGRVHVRMFLGATTRVFVHVDGDHATHEIQADVPSRDARSFAPGTAVHIRLAPEDVRVFASPTPLDG
jgi:putative spermidine/putrescine transport system ATP-binding protein